MDKVNIEVNEDMRANVTCRLESGNNYVSIYGTGIDGTVDEAFKFNEENFTQKARDRHNEILSQQRQILENELKECLKRFDEKVAEAQKKRDEFLANYEQ